VQSLVLSYAQVTQKTASKHTTTNSSNKSECGLFYFYHKVINTIVKSENILFWFVYEKWKQKIVFRQRFNVEHLFYHVSMGIF